MKVSSLNFKMWQQKMFYLTTLSLARFLTESPPQIAKGASDAKSKSVVEAWKDSKYLCRNYVLNGLVDTLYNVYFKVPTAKELWELLEHEYQIEDTGTKTLMSQVQELQIIHSDILFEK
ncbi:hypothetical protein HanRHA438_Chr13g0589801 [Helianthus annuus]|nr:hypothetical protein HanIR_Chr13g0630301 [Helianthus annuus]KAJ0857412.1 hypothetical protein HanRHA438_Chr13g0589801 [Helianthus annuus]